ncbi:DNA topoisomerase [Vibrio tubiashii]|uniref:DNA topoisomerase n=1 Tax=Vibrio tubiashii TaxID=29498 RepID=UPI001EFD3D6D|nr:DNA topoisomerase [Vibrio tubiashii]MCG9579570.1 DNA topoisomerase [Vibrio tubiashii]
MLIVTEKYRTASIIAKALGFQHFEYDHFANDHDDKICFAAGHLFSVTHRQPEEYSWQSPDSFNNLPRELFSEPKRFTTNVRGNAIPSTELLDTIVSAMQSNDLIVNACDFDREGERIFYDIFNRANTQARVYRMDLSKGLSRRLVCEAYANLLDGTATKHRYYASSGRDCGDFAYALLTQVATYHARQGSLHPELSGYRDAKSSTVSVGRVQIPLLLLIGLRCKEVEQYSARTVAVPVLKAKIGRYSCEFIYDGELSGTDEALLERGRLANNYVRARGEYSNTVTVVAITVDEVIVDAPAPHNTPSIQAAMKTLTPSETMNALQSLYMKGCISYPRSDSDKLSGSHYSNGRLASLLESLANNQDEGFAKKVGDESSLNQAARALEFAPPPACVQDQASTAHSAIVPTDVTASAMNLTDNEQMVYNEIASRFVASTAGAQHCQQVTLSIRFQDESLGLLGEPSSIFTCSKTIGMGDNKLTRLRVGDCFDVSSLDVTEKHRDVPNYYAISELPMIMFEAGLGTAATRDGAVSKLQQRYYIESLTIGGVAYAVITAKGLALLSVLPKEFKTPALTAKWEKMLNDIEQTEDPSDAIQKRNEFIGAVFDSVQYLCRLLNTKQLTSNAASSPASEQLLEQVKERAAELNLTIDPLSFTTRRACHDFLLANPLPYHTKQKRKLARSGLHVDDAALRDGRRVALRQEQATVDKPPSSAQLLEARQMSQLVHLKIPPSAMKSAEKCSQFIDLCHTKRKPTVAQIRALKKLAQEHSYPLTKEILGSRKKTKQLTTELRKKGKRSQK